MATIAIPSDGFEPLIRQVAGALDARIDAERAARWLTLLSEWAPRMNLTAARSAVDLVDMCIADACAIARSASTDGAWVDVGSGAGAPGIALALLGANVRTLVEPRAKRVAFLRTVVSSLGLDCRVERTRSERLEGGAHDVAVSRATLGPAAWLVEGTRLARAHVWVLVAGAEPPAIAGWEITLDERYELPLTRVSRRALRYSPVGETHRSPPATLRVGEGVR